MGKTVLPITMEFQKNRAAFEQFTRALSPSDQRVIDELWSFAAKHIAPAGYAEHLLPMEVFLLSMLLEQHKEVIWLQEKVVEILG